MPHRLRVTPSAAVATLLVLAAGAVAWVGTNSGGDEQTPPASRAVTISSAGPVAEAPGADGPLLSQGNLPTRLVIPSAGVDTPIVEVGVSRDEAGHASWETAWRAAGHHLDSARPGQPGNMVITGHVSVADRSNVAVFKSLESVKAGDVVEVSSGDTVYHYRVSAVSVAPANAVSVLKSGHQSTLTLITCTRDLKYRVVVTGTLVDAL